MTARSTGGQRVADRARSIPLLVWLVLALLIVLAVLLLMPKAPLTLTLLGEDSSNLQAMQQLAGEYEKQSGIRIRFVPQTFEELQRAGDADLSSGAGTYDIILNYNFS